MSNLSLIIEEKAANIGNFLVGRLLPFRQKRMVGPFIFIDHMGPADIANTELLNIPPHPHIGLSTLTYLLEGAMLHRDSLQNEIVIFPGDVNWMTAGRGVVHSERSPNDYINQYPTLHGLQIWVALPTIHEEVEPSFHQIKANELPSWNEDDVKFKLIAGKIDAYVSPVPVYSPLYLLEIQSEKRKNINLKGRLYGESAIYVLEGAVEIEGNVYDGKQLLVTLQAELCSFTILENSKIYIFGGEAFPEERYIEWNFVSSSKDRLNQAKQKWMEQKFERVIHETEFVPLPDYYTKR